MSDQNIQLNKPDSTYVYKKTEKLVSALYLLSSFISDKEPLKWKIREAGLDLLSVNQISLVSLILSYLEIAYMGGIISQMNYGILKYELENLLVPVEQIEKDKLKGAIITPDFFVANNSKGQNNMSDRPDRQIGGMSDKQKAVRYGNQGGDKSNRQTVIITLLKKGDELGIKDFTSGIKDCSEKTIQRELASLVSKGLIKKQGEKRWSKYSLR